VTAIVTPVPVVRRQERFTTVGSTNDVIRDWLAAGEPEICVAVADEQSSGRGRSGRTWTAPAGAGLLLSIGFRPTWLAPDQVWRLAATVSLAMAEAAEAVAGLPERAIGLKWPNDLVIEVDESGRAMEPDQPAVGLETATRGAAVRKLGGILGETDGLGTGDPRAIIGIGLNADWPTPAFPPELSHVMTSLRAAAGERPVEAGNLLDGFLSRLEPRVEELHGGRFDEVDWIDRQVTTGRTIEVLLPDGSTHSFIATGVDALTGALRVGDPGAPGEERSIVVGEIVHVRLLGR
jgi:BirA family biotin operon repressor/biotin-[acetyl-CoA-carboxylase] ligase